jgi:magnesium transporter
VSRHRGGRRAAEALARLSPSERAVRFRLLEKDEALGAFEAMDAVHQRELLEALRDPAAHELLEEMDPDDRARMLHEAPATVARRLLAGLSPHERALTADLLGYPDQSAGRMMSPEVIRLRASMTAGQAIEHAGRTGAEAETIYTLPVTDEERTLVGVVELRDLVLADPAEKVANLMAIEPEVAVTHDDQEAVARLMQEADLLALPVVDGDHRLVGIVTVDDAMEVLEAEDSEDVALVSASQPLRDPYLSVSVARLVRSRIGWLLLLIAAAALTVSVLDAFEDTLEQVVTLALFVPLLIGTGGNAGAQAATTLTRALAVGEVRLGDLAAVVARETRVGLLLGATFGMLGYLPVALLFDSGIATVVSLTLVAICTLATFVGSVLPLLAKRLGVDPAVVSAPMITTIVDATGLVVYFLIARAVLGLA